MDVDNIVVGVVWADLGFELVVKWKGLKTYQYIQRLKRTSLASQMIKN